MVRLRIVLTGVMAVLCHAIDSAALNYKVIANDGTGQRVLLAYNCGYIANDADCPAVHPEFMDSFAPGDVERLRQQWSRGPFAEVWLLSGGGMLDEGIGLANEFRSRGQAVRVPNARRLRAAGLVPAVVNGERRTNCVSSCTVAFMGGQLRFVDLEPGDEATYQVHAASIVAWNDLNARRTQESIAVVQKAATADLGRFATFLAADNRVTAQRLFALFQDTLWLVVKPRSQNDPERLARDRALDAFAGIARPYPYPEAQAARDKALLELEGQAALQDILMRVERHSMMLAIEDLRGILPRLGRRAEAALAMLGAMYDTSSILETNRMPKETLLKMGYITELIPAP